MGFPLVLQPPNSETQVVSPAGPAKSAKDRRLVSIDAFRGAVILLMLLVNNMALDTQTPIQFTHADWSPVLHLADLVAPWFLFCVGVSIPFSSASFARSGKGKGRHFRKVLTRSFALFFLGCVVDSSVNHHIGIAVGVLQLIGLAYLVAATVYEGPFWLRVAVSIGLLAGYAWLLLRVGFPGGAAGMFEENRNVVQYINDTYLVRLKIDGILSTIPAAALVLYGSMVGDTLRQSRWSDGAKLSVLVISGLALMIAGNVGSAAIPFNKPVWTPTYILVAGGSGAILLAGFRIVFDLLRLSRLAFPLSVFGSNAIVAYVVPILVKVLVFQQWLVRTPTGNLPAQQASLAWLKTNYGQIAGGWTYTVAYIAVWWLVLWLLYRKKLFVRV